MKIAILGWGSLVWDPRELPITGDWHRGGPILPVEFSRISGHSPIKKGERLTLVIDEECGTNLPTRFAYSVDNDVHAARNSLFAREGAFELKAIACIDLLSDARFAVGSQRVSAVIESWAKANALDGVVWTGLPSNFSKILHTPYSWEAAFRFLESLTPGDRQRAFEYIRKAPEEVRTPFRAEFDQRYPST